MIVGISGFINSGKNTVASILTEKYNFRQDSFAASLKDACAVMFDWPRHMVEGDTKESREWREQIDQWWANKLGIPDFSPRLALQLMGTDVIRNHFNQGMWFLTLENRIRKNPDKHVVISDVRFPNEIKFIQDQGGIMIRVNRGTNPVWYDTAIRANANDNSAKLKMETSYADAHFSEWAWVGSKFDYEMSNDSTLDDLHRQIDIIVSKIK